MGPKWIVVIVRIVDGAQNAKGDDYYGVQVTQADVYGLESEAREAFRAHVARGGYRHAYIAPISSEAHA